MGFGAPESPKGSSSLGLEHSPSLPVEEACASSGARFGVPGSLEGTFVGVGSELARGRPSLITSALRPSIFADPNMAKNSVNQNPLLLNVSCEERGNPSSPKYLMGALDAC